MFTNQDLKKLIIPLFLEQLLVAYIDESQRLVSFNVPTRGCYRFSYLRQGRFMCLGMFI